MMSPGRQPRERRAEKQNSPRRGRQMMSLGRRLAARSDLWATAEMEGRVVVVHRPLAGGGESRRPKAVRNPSSKGIHSSSPSGLI